MTPPQARNGIRKALIGIIDPQPTKASIAAMWGHFESSCAFCSVVLDRKSRSGHGDHLVPASAGGRNHVCNRVLACATCNGDEKLDKDWVAFLKAKSPNAEEFGKRKRRIESWREAHQASCQVSEETVAAAMNAAEQAIEAFNHACETVRALRPAQT